MASLAPIMRRIPLSHVRRNASSTNRGPAPETRAHLDRIENLNALEQAELSVQQDVTARQQRRRGAPMQWHLQVEDKDAEDTRSGLPGVVKSRRRDFPAPSMAGRVQHVPFEGVSSQEMTASGRNSGFKKEKERVDDVYGVIDEEPGRSSTMTNKEKQAFQRLFGSWSGRPSARPPTARYSDPTSAIDAIDPQMADTSSFFDPVTSNTRLTPPMEITSFPAEIRAMAARAKREAERRRKREAATAASRAEEQGWEPLVRRVEQEMYEAQTDRDVWTVLQKQVFTPLQDLDRKIKGGVDGNGDSKSNKQAESKLLMTEPDPIAMGCSSLFTVAMRLFARRTMYSHYADILLSSIKSHCYTTSVLGISTPLYNELLSHSWRVHQDLSGISRLLEEMDAAGLEPDQSTLDTLSDICGWVQRAQTGMYGLGVQAVENLIERQQDAARARRWRDEIKSRLDRMAVELSRRQEQERQLGLEGAFSDSDEKPVEPFLPESSSLPEKAAAPAQSA